MPSSDALTAVDEIVVGKRVRKDAPNIAQLTESIRAVGLLQPIVVNSRNELVAGFRRLQAVKRLGWGEVPVRRIDTLDDVLVALKAERDENTCREPLSPSEIVEIGRQIEEIERPEAAKRKAATLKQNKDDDRSAKLAERESKGETRQKVAAALGVGHTTYEKAKKVAEAAEADPEKFGHLTKVMDEKSIDAAYRELKAETAAEPVSQPAEAEPGEVEEVTPGPDGDAEPEPDPADEFVAAVEAVCRDLDQVGARIRGLKASPYSYAVHWQAAADQVKAARSALWNGRPLYKCPYCNANGQVDEDCRACRGTNRVYKGTYDRGVAAVGGGDE